jgi:hypothetical protein
MKKLLLILAPAAFAVTAVQAQIINLTVDPGEAWIHYVNTFNLSDDTSPFGFAYSDNATVGGVAQATFSGADLSLGPNIGIYDVEIGTPAWVDQGTLAPILYTEVNTYYEFDSTAGTTVNFDWVTLSNALAGLTGTPTNDATATVSYDVQGFIKVLDPGAGWATVSDNLVPLALGTQSASVLVPATVGTPKVQVGFFVTGNILAGADPLGSTFSTVTAVPEPGAFALLGGLVALGIVIYRRRKA